MIRTTRTSLSGGLLSIILTACLPLATGCGGSDNEIEVSDQPGTYPDGGKSDTSSQGGSGGSGTKTDASSGSGGSRAADGSAETTVDSSADGRTGDGQAGAGGAEGGADVSSDRSAGGESGSGGNVGDASRDGPGGATGDGSSTDSAAGTDSGSGGNVGDAASDGGTGGSGGTGADSGGGGSDASVADASEDSPTTTDAQSDAACATDNTQCTVDGASGLCKSGVCSACTETTDDTSCAAAYGSGSGYICIGGSCVAGDCHTNSNCTAGQICGLISPNLCGACTTDAQCKASSSYGATSICVSNLCITGDCHTDTDCPTGQICGLSAPNTCAKCTSDAQCQADATYGAATICNTTSGACVTNACTSNNQACTANAGDYCCNSTCVPGNCCVTADCAPLGNNLTCSNNSCVQCPLTTGNVYYVDPQNGSDTAGTGSGATTSCAFKTITRALQWIGTTPAAGTQVLVRPTAAATTANGEVFPMYLPANLILSGTGGNATIQVAGGLNGFVLAGHSSGLKNLVLDGQTQAGGYGITVTTGTDTTTTLENITVQKMGREGILVTNSGVVTIGPGVVSQNNGTSAARHNGLLVRGSGKAIINVPSGAATTAFNSNTAHGIQVLESSSITLTGVPGTAGAGTVTTNGNYAAGIWINQTPAASVPINDINGVVSWANTAGSGVRIVAGSSVTMRNSYLLANAANGIIVSTYVDGTTGTRVNDVSKIDLGTITSWGNNTVQTPAGGNPNIGAGICFSIDANQAAGLRAAGNVFAGPIDCATSMVALRKANTCANAVDVATTGPRTNTNTVIISQCY